VAASVAPVQTVHIDFDLDAPEEEQLAAREQAGCRVRQACATLGTDPEAALKKLAAVFSSLPIAHCSEGQDASAALAKGLEASKGNSFFDRQPAPYASVQTPQAPEEFEYLGNDTSMPIEHLGTEMSMPRGLSPSTPLRGLCSVGDSAGSFDSSSFEFSELSSAWAEFKDELVSLQPLPALPHESREEPPMMGQWGEELKQLCDMGLTGDNSEWELVEMLETHLGSLDRGMSSTLSTLSMSSTLSTSCILSLHMV